MNIQKLELANLLILSILLIFLSGCAWTHKHDPKPFGSSVRTMVKSQIYDRSTIKNPPTDVVEGMDSTKAISDIRKVYRKTEVNKQQLKHIDRSGKK